MKPTDILPALSLTLLFTSLVLMIVLEANALQAEINHLEQQIAKTEMTMESTCE